MRPKILMSEKKFLGPFENVMHDTFRIEMECGESVKKIFFRGLKIDLGDHSYDPQQKSFVEISDRALLK